jgi:serine/threonine protein kinase
MPNYVGQTIGQYQLIQLINESDNAVYKGLQPAMNRYVAVKILGSAQSNDLAFVQQFQRDMQAISGLNHPNILPLMDYGQHNEQLYMVTPFVEGGTLRQRMAEFQTPWQAQTLITAIAAAVEQIHDRGMVHGNLKPGNILLNTQGEPLLTDFGFTQGIDTGIRENPYLSPELLQSGTLDRRSDTYALGASSRTTPAAPGCRANAAGDVSARSARTPLHPPRTEPRP